MRDVRIRCLVWQLIICRRMLVHVPRLAGERNEMSACYSDFEGSIHLERPSRRHQIVPTHGRSCCRVPMRPAQLGTSFSSILEVVFFIKIWYANWRSYFRHHILSMKFLHLDRKGIPK